MGSRNGTRHDGSRTVELLRPTTQRNNTSRRSINIGSSPARGLALIATLYPVIAADADDGVVPHPNTGTHPSDSA